MTRADVILMIQFNALIRYRDSNGNEHHGYVIGDSHTRWAGKNSYTITVKDPNAYSIDGCRLDDIVEVVDWHIPEEHRANATEIVRRQIINSYFNGDPSGEPEITYMEGTA
jgi:hypothetical protein